MSCLMFWRTRLRDDFVARLTDATPAGSRVYSARALPFDVTDPTEAAAVLPAINVWVDDADFDGAASNGFTATADVGVQITVTGDTETEAEDALAAVSYDVYHALFEQQFERCTVTRFRDEPVAGLDGAVYFAVTRLTITVEFELCLEPDIDTVAAFEEAHIHVDQQTPDGTIGIAVVALPEQPPEEPEP